jgi:hypothetical protein
MQTSQLTSEKRYTYSELEGSAKDRARQHYIEHWIIDDWYDSVYYDFKSEGIVHGFHIEDIKFSGFWSQGDGASWYGDVDMKVFIEKNLPECIGRDCWLWLLQSGWVHDRLNIYQRGNHYAHSHTMSVGNIEVYADEGDDDILQLDCILKGAPVSTLWNLILADTACPIKRPDDLEELVLTEARQYADEIYDGLREAYEYECSDENIAESYNINDQFFNHEGEQL